MGLFSFLSKKKPDSTAQDSGYYSSADESSSKARTKRASGAQAKAIPSDLVLPEKKRARRRLVGAIALALAVAIGLPMLLDSEPKPLSLDIAIQIPSKNQDSPAVTSSVAAGDSLAPAEQIVAMPPDADAPAPPGTVAPMPLPPLKPLKPLKSEVQVAESKPEPRTESKPELKLESKPAARVPDSAPVAATKPASKPAESTRALAILEGRTEPAKPAPVASSNASASSSSSFVVQVAALATQDKVDELQSRLKAAGINSYTQTISTSAGQSIRVRVGPFGSREDAEKALARVAKLGLGGFVAPS
jgi:DedD protein